VSSVDIVIVNWNSGERLRECLARLRDQAAADVRIDRVVVVDNASMDGSADGLAMPDVEVEVHRNAANVGFARACNQGARGSVADFILFLNPDAAPEPGALAVAARHFEDPAHARTGIIGVQLTDEVGQVARACARFPSAWGIVGASLALDRVAPGWCPPHFMAEWDHLEDRAVDQVIGAFFLVRRSVFEALGGFDERYFLYYEEVDFSRRAANAGWRSWYCAHARTFHEGGGSSSAIPARRLFLVLRSRLQYAREHFSRLEAALVYAVTLVVEPFSRAVISLHRRGLRGVGETLRGYAMLWRDLPIGARAERPAR
jgi:N-acetylglucosaminyl-diphospho-decaprenol L-rhamnosyltransferase